LGYRLMNSGGRIPGGVCKSLLKRKGKQKLIEKKEIRQKTNGGRKKKAEDGLGEKLDTKRKDIKGEIVW